MKKELEKILKAFKTSFNQNESGIEVSLYQCDCCGDWTATIYNPNSDVLWETEINDIEDMNEFVDIFAVSTGDHFFGVVAAVKDMKEKKLDKYLDLYCDMRFR